MSFHRHSSSLALGVTAVLVTAGEVRAVELPSTAFNHQYNGDVYAVPNYLENGTIFDPSSNGDIFTYRAAQGGGYYSSTNWSVSGATGFTIEFRIKIGTDFDEGSKGAFAVYYGDGSAGDIFSVGKNYVKTADGNIVSDANDNTDAFHIFRIAQLEDGGGPGAPTINMWRDGVLVQSFPNGGNWGNNVLYWGSGGSPFGGPTVQMDYLRWDNTGAYTPPVVANPQWSGTSGDWNTAGNWAGPVPNAVDAAANFLGAITSPQTVFTNTAVTVGSLKFDNANGYQIAGQGSLSIDVTTGSGSISVVQGSHKINLPLFIKDNTTADIAAGATLQISNPMTLVGGTVLTKSGDGTLSIEAPVSNVALASLASAAGATNVLMDLGTNMNVGVSGGTTTLRARQHLASLAVSGGQVKVGPGTSVVVATKSLAISGAGQVDLQNGKLIVDYTGASPIASVKSAINAGSLTSSLLNADRAIGYGEASDLFTSFPATFAGESVDADSVLVAYTVVADASLDGTVSSTDFNLLVGHFGQNSGSRWTQGDFDGNSKVNTLDFNLLAGHFGQSLPVSASLGAVVPEPAAAMVLSVVGAGLLIRRKRS